MAPGEIRAFLQDRFPGLVWWDFKVRQLDVQKGLYLVTFPSRESLLRHASDRSGNGGHFRHQDWQLKIQEWHENLFGYPARPVVGDYQCWISLRNLLYHIWSEGCLRWAVSGFARIMGLGKAVRTEADHEEALARIAYIDRLRIPQQIVIHCRGRDF